ncbi:MAG: YdjY domain-containing protein [Phycisphaerales bacterium]|nr:YdjY domain-containing protein [Phycisphaerales bacterium]
MTHWLRFILLALLCSQGLTGLVSCQSSRPSPAGASSRTVIAPGLWVDLEQGYVEFRGWTCLDTGWLEQVVCSPGTREHESLIVTDLSASKIHAALLLLGLKPGTPGTWETKDGEVIAISPSGPGVMVGVGWTDPEGGPHRTGISQWIIDVQDRAIFPTDRWIFAGSIELTGKDAERAGAAYLADRTGSIIGLVTFGDELLAAEVVIPDAADVREPEWVANTRNIPPPGTVVMVRLVPARPGQIAFE